LTVPATPPFMQPGNRTGTANYMAPEVVRRRPTSQKLDIYAFGATIYELLAYELPWPRGTDGQATMAHGAEAPTDLSEHCPNIHPKLAAAVASCLEAEPARRPASMSAFLQMIRGVERETVG
jgi:serine/threonine-protein kinase